MEIYYEIYKVFFSLQVCVCWTKNEYFNLEDGFSLAMSKCWITHRNEGDQTMASGVKDRLGERPSWCEACTCLFHCASTLYISDSDLYL